MSRFALRVGPEYPFPKYRGDVIHLGDSTREQVEDIREQMVTGRFHEVVEVDEAGRVATASVSGPQGEDSPEEVPVEGWPLTRPQRGAER